MRFSKEYIASIVINLLSNIFWYILSSAVAIFIGSVPVVVFSADLKCGIVISLVLFLLLLLYIKSHNKLIHIKWDFFIKNNTYELKLYKDGTACFSQKFKAKICTKGICKLPASYDWSCAETITKAEVESRFANWTLWYKPKNESAYTSIKGNQGIKALPISEKEIDYIIEYDDCALSKTDDVENEVNVNFTYNKANMDTEFYAGIRHCIGELNIKVYAPSSLIKDVKFYVKTVLGKEYIVIRDKPLESCEDGAGKYYAITIKKPKLFCKYIIKWEWA